MCSDDGRTTSFCSSNCWPVWYHEVYTDGWGAYERHLDAEQHQVGARRTPENREQAHQLADPDQTVNASYVVASPRRSACTISSIGLFINRYEFGASFDLESTLVRHFRCGKVILVFGPCEDVRQANAATTLVRKPAVARQSAQNSGSRRFQNGLRHTR